MSQISDKPVPRIAVTPGEPAGIGPDVVVALASRAWPVEIVVIADADLLAERAATIGVAADIRGYAPGTPSVPSAAGCLTVAHRPLRSTCVTGKPDTANAAYVVETLERACDGCMAGEFAAMVTAPVHKGVINDAGIRFSGHTEFLAQRTDAPLPVMLLVAGELRVALATTHLPLRAVPAAIDAPRLRDTIRILDHGLRTWFRIPEARIAVLGLNPHAGESGHLGLEEQQIIAPVLDELRAEGLRLAGPVPADTAFTVQQLANADAVLAMYHDQGLPVLKHASFGHAVNVTLGLPIIRTSVDHGTALALAGSGTADGGSLRAALRLAIDIQARAAR